MIDPSVIDSVKKGDNGAFKVLYQSCIRYVYSIVRRYVSNESDHADVIQEIFARIFLSIKSFDRSKGTFKPWMRRIVINQCIQHYRKIKRNGVVVPIESVQEIEATNNEKFAELTKEEIEFYLRKMPDGYRQVFMLVVIDEYSHKEVGELLGITAVTSRSQLSRAKSWLKKSVLNNNFKISASGL